jgi:prepilin-type N-terminal cleavage/methylation domain-containing protein
MEGAMDPKSPIVARHQQDQAGLTLIELLIVVLIMGILAAIVILGIGAFQGTGNHEACTASSQTVQAAEAGFYSNRGRWADILELVAQGYLQAKPNASWGIDVDTTTGDVSNTCP